MIRRVLISCMAFMLILAGLYDAASGRVLVLDVDWEYYGPYWVGVERLLTALSAETPSYGHGGVLIVRRISR